MDECGLMPFVRDTKPVSAWIADGDSSAFWYFSALVIPLSEVPFCYDTGLVPGAGVFGQDSRPTSTWTADVPGSSTWAEDAQGSNALFFDTWDDSFDLVETCFDDDNEVPGQEFTEDTHP